MATDADHEGLQLAQFRQAAAERPDSPVAQMQLGTAWMRVGAIRRAEEALERAVELDPDYTEAWVNLGGARLSRWDFAGCVEINRKVAERHPDLMLAHYNQGLGHLYLGEAEAMTACFRRALELEPDHPGANYHLAVGLLALDKTAEARARLDRAIELGFSPQPQFLKALERKERGGNPSPAVAVDDAHAGDGATPRKESDNARIHGRDDDAGHR